MDGASVAQQQGRYLPAQSLVGDYRPGGGRGGRVTLTSSIRLLLMGHVPGGYQPCRDYFCSFGLIIPLYCKTTALICYIYLNVLVPYSVVIVKLTGGAGLSKKRGNGAGSIHRRKDGGWCAQYTVYTAKGRKRKTLYGKTRGEVAK